MNTDKARLMMLKKQLNAGKNPDELGRVRMRLSWTSIDDEVHAHKHTHSPTRPLTHRTHTYARSTGGAAVPKNLGRADEKPDQTQTHETCDDLLDPRISA